ncbi:hypothetical protein FQZ97_1184720 [compost metagenome]
MMALLLVVAVGVAHHQAVAMLPAGGFHALHHGHRVGVEDIRHQHADQPRLAALQAPGHLVRPVAQARDDLFDAPRGGVGQQLAITDVAGHRGLGYASGPRHFTDGDPLPGGGRHVGHRRSLFVVVDDSG